MLKNGFLTIMSSKELLKSTGAVLSKFIKCLKENAYIDDKKFDVLYGEVNKNKDALPKVEELADLFFENGRRNIKACSLINDRYGNTSFTPEPAET